MIGAYASLALVVGASIVVGHAVLLLCGRGEPSPAAPAVGLAVLLVTAATAVRLPGHAATAAVALLVLVVLAGAALVARRPAGLAVMLTAGLPAALLAVLVASLPFIVAGRVGILGVGLVNDDMAYHLLLGSWLDERFLPEPVLVDQGYPLGPHSVAAALSKGLGAELIGSFAGLTLAIPALIALVAHGAMASLRPVARTLVASAVALPYLVAAYVAQEAFKEPIMALFLLAFALALPAVKRARDAIPLGLLAGGTLYVYSFPGLAWLVGTALIWGAVELIRGRRAGRSAPAILRPAALPVALAFGVALAFALIDLERLRDFADFRALDPDRANEGGLGNLHGHLSPLEALGLWPTSEFRLSAGAGSLPAAIFYAGALLAALAFALAVPRWMRRYGPAIPAALATAALVYIGARAYGTVYTSAKALAIVAPLLTLITFGGLLTGNEGNAAGALGGRRGGYRVALAALVMLGLALSTFLVLRSAPVGPQDHMNELAQIRPLVQGERLLFLGRDNFVSYELRGAKPFTHVRNFYDPFFVKPNFELENVAYKFDFDSVAADRLATFPYVITTRAAYASGPPPGYRLELLTGSYALWKQEESPAGRKPVERGPEPTGRLDCSEESPSGVAATMLAPPVLGPSADWTPSATVENGTPASIILDLPAGRWLISLQYDATRPIELKGPGMSARLPGNLDYRGAAPFWAAARLETGRDGPATFQVSVERPPLAGRLLGAHSVAHLGAIAATPEGSADTPGLPRFAPDYPGSDPVYNPARPGASVDLLPARFACGEQVDWTAPGRSPLLPQP